MGVSAAATLPHQPAPVGDRNALDALTHELVRDLHTARPAIFWLDMLASAAAGWAGLAFAVAATPWSAGFWIAAAVAVFALYRGLCFIHELTHLRRGAIPGFETTWNLLLGVPLLLPSFTYIGVHQAHHHVATYGTKDDPEYLPFARSRALIWTFSVQSAAILPLLLLVRFVVLAPIGLVRPRFHRWLEAHASSFSMNPQYRRLVSDEGAAKFRRWEVAVFVTWFALLALVAAGRLPARVFPVWYLVMFGVSLLNTARVLGAHAYEAMGEPLDRHGQLRDSIDTPGGPWTELWAPVGLRYHALHHFFPGIPYHNLGVAYRRIVRAVPNDSAYLESTSPSLKTSLVELYAKASASSRPAE